MSRIKLNIEEPDLFKECVKTINGIHKTNFDFFQDNLLENKFEGNINTEKLSSFYILGREYGFSLFKKINKLKLTGLKKKISKTIYQDNVKDGFLSYQINIELLNKNKIDLQLAFLGFSESSQFSRIFSVMDSDDKADIEKFVGIKTHHYKTSFIHKDFNVKYQIIENNLLFFKTYDNNKKIELDSIIEVIWTN